MQSKVSRTKRILAFLLDYILPLLFLRIIVFAASFLIFDSIFLLIVLIAGISYFPIFILRDYLFDGQSIGKRIFKLRVVDAITRSHPSAKQLIVKNLILFIGYIDLLFLLFSKRSLGERASDTIVVYDQPTSCSEYCPDAPQGSFVKKRIKKAMVVVVAIAILLFLVCSVTLNATKKQDDYKIAYNYLKNSTAYMQTDKGKIIFSGYASSTQFGVDHEVMSANSTFTFLVKGRIYTVVCHRNGNTWYVCNDCTHFQ